MAKNVLALYLHGSRVYGCNTDNSDWDVIAVVNDDVNVKEQITVQNIDITIFKKSQWEKMAEENDCDFLECYFLDKKFKYVEDYVPQFKLDISKIRSNFSQKASNSFVKCKKKLTVEKDYAPYIGKKSLFHSFRLLQFGIQILEKGKIVDYTSANDMYNDIVNSETNDWNYFKAKYQQPYNHLKSQFRLAETTSILN